jgi:hypothetical protein
VKQLSTQPQTFFVLARFADILLDSAPILKGRNFDQETRTLKKRDNQDVEMKDTVERNVQGLAENIVQEDELRRAQELASILLLLWDKQVFI